MELLCILDTKWVTDSDKIGYGPSYMEKVTAIDECDGYYILAEYYRNPYDNVRESYIKEAFIPLSSIDETEMERDFKTEKVSP